MNSIKPQNLSPTLIKLTLHNSKVSILTPLMAPSHQVGNFFPSNQRFFPHDFTLIASVVGESVIGHGNILRYIWLWHVPLRPDAGVSDDRLVCHHPISQPLTTSDGLKIQVRLRHVLRKDPTISYVEYFTNLSNELGRVHVAGILKRISYKIQVSYVCK